MSGLFGTFNIAKRGINVSQATIDVTSHNMANANTEGYSRQRAEIVTSRPSSPGMYKGQVGTGAQIEAINRIRDTFLDYQVRGESSALGKAEVRNEVLYQIEGIFNEPSDTGISTLLGKFFDGFQELSKQPNSSNARTVAIQQAVSLTSSLNHVAIKLEELQANAQSLLKNNCTDINSALDQINKLNKEIKMVTASGENPNDLMDKRDLLLDQLSKKFNLTVDEKSFNGIDVKTVDSCGMKNPTLVSAAPNDQQTRFSYITSIEKDPNYPNIHVITYAKLGDTSKSENFQTIRVADLTDSQIEDLSKSRLIWADEEGNAVKGDGYKIKNNGVINGAELMVFTPSSGEVAGNITVQDDISNYIDQLNKLAKAIAFSVNAIHSGLTNPLQTGGDPEKDFMPFFVNQDVAYYGSDRLLSNLDETLSAESEITAKNISINIELIDDVMKLKTRTHDNNFSYANENNVDGEGDGARALAIAKLRDSLIRIQDFGTVINSRDDLVTTNFGMTIEDDTSGTSMDSFFKDIIDKLGVQAQEANRQEINQNVMLNELENSRQSVAGVSLDEELANLIQFQHAYSANAKIISTIDELLDEVVNGLKR